MKYFRQEMTSAEARKVLFTIVDGMSASEREAVKKEYSRILPVILQREAKQSMASKICWLTSD